MRSNTDINQKPVFLDTATFFWNFWCRSNLEWRALISYIPDPLRWLIVIPDFRRNKKEKKKQTHPNVRIFQIFRIIIAFTTFIDSEKVQNKCTQKQSFSPFFNWSEKIAFSLFIDFWAFMVSKKNMWPNHPKRKTSVVKKVKMEIF